MTPIAPYPVHLVGWVLAQFLWQGTVVLGLLLLGRRLLRRSRPRFRHDVALGALAALAALPVMTAVVTHRALQVDPSRSPARTSSGAASPTVVVARAFDASAPIVTALVGIWASSVVWGAVSLLAGHRRLRRLRFEPAAADPVREAAASLARAAGIGRAPSVVESSRVTTPLVAGWRVPVLVLPPGLPERLGRAELRAVLLHEIAHIRRRDYLVNLLQRVVEVVLWFHPAVRIASRELREQREYCCDEEAAEAGGGRLAVARALVLLEELRGVTPMLALGGAGSHGGLGARVRHLAAPLPAASRRDAVATLGLGVAAALALAASARLPTGAATGSSTLRSLVPVVDVSAVDPAGRFAVRLVGGRATSVILAGTRVESGRLRQRGRVVEVLGADGRPELRLNVEPGGRGMRWSPRSPRAP